MYPFGTDRKKKVSMNYSSSKSSWKLWRWLRLDLVLLMRDIYISSNLKPLTKLTSSSKSSEFNNISSHGISLIKKTIPISTRTVISYAMKWGISLWIWWKVNGKWDNNVIRISQWRESHRRVNTSIRRKKEIQKIIRVYKSSPDLSVPPE